MATIRKRQLKNDTVYDIQVKVTHGKTDAEARRTRLPYVCGKV